MVLIHKGKNVEARNRSIWIERDLIPWNGGDGDSRPEISSFFFSYSPDMF
jgi:hypothetical protein